MESTRASPTNITHVHVHTWMDAHIMLPRAGWTHWTDTGLIWWDSTTVLPVLHGTIGQDGQGFFRAVVAVLHGTMGTDTIGYYSTYAMGKDRHRIDQ